MQVDGAGIFNNCVCRANDINYDDYYYVNYYYANYINELYQDVLYGDEAAPEGETEEQATDRKRRAIKVLSFDSRKNSSNRMVKHKFHLFLFVEIWGLKTIWI